MPERADDSQNGSQVETLALRNWSLRYWLELSWARKYLILACIAAWLIVALLAIRLLPPVYTVSMVVGPKTSGLTQRAETGIAAKILGAAGGDQSNSFEVYFELLTSTSIGMRLSQEHKIERRIWASQWDERGQRWVPPGGAISAVARWVKLLVGWPAWQPPEGRDVGEYLALNVRREATRAGLFDVNAIYRISIRSRDPTLGVDLLNLLHQEVDGQLRAQRIHELDIAIAYLEDKLRLTTIVAAQTAMADALAAAVKERVLLLGDSSYAAILIDPPFLPKRPSFPQPALLLATALVFGMLSGFAAAVIVQRRHLRRLAAQS